MTYLIMQIFLYLICALLLGLILGWFIWGRLSDRVRAMQSERDEALAKLRARGDGSQDRAKLDALTKDLDECRRMRHDQDDEIERLNRELSAARDPAGSMSAAPVAAAAAGLTVSTEEDKPSTLSAARGGQADDLKLIKGVGPKMEDMLNGMGFWHFDQIAAWSKQELAWVDDNLDGFKGRASRDEWIPQAKILAAGGTTEFSQRTTS